SVGNVGSVGVDGQALDNDYQNGANEIQRKSNGPESVGFGVGVVEAAKPLNYEEKLSNSNDTNVSNGSERDKKIAPLPTRPARPNLIPNKHRCDHCGVPGTAADLLHGWDWPGRPDGIRLHSRCEAPWMDRSGIARGARQ